MSLKEIIGIIIIIFALLSTLNILAFTKVASEGDLEKTTQEGAKLIQEEAIPWWIDVVLFLTKLGTFGGLLIAALFLVLLWYRNS